jgi:hypothetical protein
MKKNLVYVELNPEQRRIYVDVVQVYQALEEARLQARHYAGYMTWKKANGKEYLFKGRAGARGVGKSLGVRNPQAEAQYSAFYRGKESATQRVKSLEAQVDLKSKYAIANKLNRVPREATRVCRVLNQSECRFTVVGSNALYGYEALAGLHFDLAVIATADLDILLDTRERLKISIDEHSPQFIELLRKADKTFVVSEQQGFRAINNKGYMVDLITAPKSPVHLPNEFAETLEMDLDIAEIEKLEWLISAPHLETLPIGYDGVPVRLTVPDPRAFAMHKYYVSQQRNRDPVKKQRDDLQARLMLRVVHQFLPEFGFTQKTLRNFPEKLRDDFLSVKPSSDEERLW